MTSDAVPVGADPRRLLADARDLARRVRVAQRVTWLPLFVLALVILGAIPVYLFSHPVLSDCQAVDDGQVCRAWHQTAQIYWWTALALAYVVIATGYRRVARGRGVDARVLPYVLAGVGFAVAGAAFAAVWIALDSPGYPDEPSQPVQFLFRVFDLTGAIGWALLVLAWLERHVALLLFTLAYLVVVLVPVDFGWDLGGDRQFVPMLAISGGLLLLGGAGFALAPRMRRPR
jgi:hypothetical protein